SIFSALQKWGHNRHYNRGGVHFNRGEYEQAAACFETALSEVRDPSEPDYTLALCYAAEARAHLGLAFFHGGQSYRAAEQFSRPAGENPSFPDLRYSRARIYERSGRFQEAIADLDLALADHPRYTDAHLLRAVCLGQLGELEPSVESLARALALGFHPPSPLPLASAPEWRAPDWRQPLPQSLGPPPAHPPAGGRPA